MERKTFAFATAVHEITVLFAVKEIGATTVPWNIVPDAILFWSVSSVVVSSV